MANHSIADSRLTLIKITATGKHPRGLYKCRCGNDKEIRTDHVNAGRTISCGCADTGHSTHGQSPRGIAPEYRIWEAMKRRCLNHKDKCYPSYGGRGITVCERWMHSYEAFIADMGKRPTKDHQIDRKDNNGPYAPDNCKWSTRKEQCRNRRNSRFIEYDGKRATLAEWVEFTGLDQTTISRRLKRGLSVGAALGLVVN